MPKKPLAETHPELAKQWHPTLNGDLTPRDVTPGSNKKVWWKCDKGDDHEWEMSVAMRGSSGQGCTICRGFKVVKSNCLGTLNPSLSKEWHPTLNWDLTPFDVIPGTSKKVWWKCEKGDDHEWEASIKNRNNGAGCSICSGKKVVKSNSLQTLFPDLAKQWHPTKNNGISPNQFVAGSKKKVWWKCDKGDDHEWQAAIVERTGGNTGCPICQGLKVVKSNCLETTHPKLCKEWDYKKNNKITPQNIIAGSSKKVWWNCDKGEDHFWQASPNHRTTHNSGCPVCTNQLVVNSNCLDSIYPKLAKEWHPTKNKLTPFDVSSRSTIKVWWKCSKDDGHEWKTRVFDRVNGNGCPYCDLTPQSKQELTITFELMKFFKNIDPKGFKTRLDGRLRAIDIYIPKLNLCIEFDGSYWHKNKRELDKIKSEMLLEEGFELIRVREEPLKKIYDTDVISKQPYIGKQVTNDILSVIMNKFKLEEKLISKISDYQSKSELQNQKGLERYIDKILTEKAKAK